MKNFIKTTLIICLLTLNITTQAQIKFAVKTGLNINNIVQELENGEEFKTKIKLAYHLGATVSYTINKKMSIQHGLQFSSKGFSNDLEQYEQEGVSIDGYNTQSYYYLEIPIHLIYKLNRKIQVFAGPYFALGIGGKQKWDYTISSTSDSENYKDEKLNKPIFTNDYMSNLENGENPYSALDFGLNFGLGYQAKYVLINIGYSHGLGNLSLVDSDTFKISNKVISISASYFLGK